MSALRLVAGLLAALLVASFFLAEALVAPRTLVAAMVAVAVFRPRLALLALAACRQAEGMTELEHKTVAIARPVGCVEVEAGAPIQPLLDDPAVAAVCLAPGAHHGPLRLSRAVTLWGPANAVVDGPTGTIIE